MSVYLFLRIIVCLVFGGLISWTLFTQYDNEIGNEVLKEPEPNFLGNPRPRYLPIVSGMLLPVFLFTLFIIDAAFYDLFTAAEEILSVCFTIFLQICIFYLLLLPLLPFLRQHFSARTCATLWLLPNYLYIAQLSFMTLNRPLGIINIPGNWIWVLCFIWLSGFLFVLLWRIAEHLAFRRQVLRDTAPVTDPKALNIWNDVIEKAYIRKPRFRLVTSPHITAPLSVGLFRRATRVILPQRAYSPEELELILRHEIIHIGREDAWNKFFMVFCTAMCWFNPLMWIAMRKSAEDTELSCDETVLLEADDAERKKYATLLLDTAQDERGFTTCLSASAEAIRYRLKSIAKPAKKRTGALLAGFLFAVMLFSCGFVTLAYGDMSGHEVIYQGIDTEVFSIEVYSMNEDTASQYHILDEAALHTYLSELKLSNLMGNYSLSEDTKAEFILRYPKGSLFLHLHDNILRVRPTHHKNTSSALYYVEGGIDWEYLKTIILTSEPLQVQLTLDGRNSGHALNAAPEQLWRIEGNQRILIYDANSHPDDLSRIISSQFQEVIFTFPYPLAEPCSVQIGSMSYSATPQDVIPELIIKAPDLNANCTITARYLYPNGDVYEAYYRFLIGYPNGRPEL